MSRFWTFALATLVAVSVGVAVSALPATIGGPPVWPGPSGRGVTLLPNGWRIAPAGRSLQVGDFPMSMVLSPDGRFVIVSNNGWSKPSLTIVDTAQQLVSAACPIDHAWLGLAWHPDGSGSTRRARPRTPCTSSPTTKAG